MKTIFAPIVRAHSIDTGTPMNLAVLSGATADAVRCEVGPLGLAMARYAAQGGPVKFSHAPVGVLELVDAGSFALATDWNATRLIDSGVIKMLAIELDQRGEVLDTWLADGADIEKAVTAIAAMRFQKQMERERERKPMTASEQLTSALEKAAANPGFFRKDVAVTQMPQSHRDVETWRPEARAQRGDLPPRGTSNAAIAAARLREVWPTIGQHLGSAMRANPGSREIADAGLVWASLDGQIGLGIDSRFLNGGFSVAVTPNNEALAEAWAHSGADKAAGGFLDFRKALTKMRQVPNVMSRNGAQISSRPVFSKRADDSEVDGGSEAGQLLRRHSLETALAHMKILQDKIAAAMKVDPDSMAQPHLSAAHGAAGKAKGHIEECLSNEK